MRSGHVARRTSIVFLCVLPMLAIALVAARPLREAGVHTPVGAVLFAAVVAAAWILGARALRADAQEPRRIALAGLLLIAPFALISLLWVGLGTPWDASPTENRMRYLVLLADSIAVTAGFAVLAGALGDGGERFHSSLGSVTNLLAGAAYLVWTSFEVGIYVVLVRDGKLPEAILALSDVFDLLLFVACVLSYLTTVAFAASLGRLGWLGRRATGAYVAAAVVLLAFLLLRGLSFPDPTAGVPWYTRPGFIAGIPAVPWILPFFLGVVLLRRAGAPEPA